VATGERDRPARPRQHARCAPPAALGLLVYDRALRVEISRAKKSRSLRRPRRFCTKRYLGTNMTVDRLINFNTFAGHSWPDLCSLFVSPPAKLDSTARSSAESAGCPHPRNCHEAAAKARSRRPGVALYEKLLGGEVRSHDMISSNILPGRLSPDLLICTPSSPDK